MKVLKIPFAFATLFCGILWLASCQKDEPSPQDSKPSDWVQVSNKVIFEGKEYTVKFNADKNSNKANFIQNLPEEVLLKIKEHEEKHETVQEVYIDEKGEQVIGLYKNQLDFEANSKLFNEALKVYSNDSKEPIRLRGLNGGKAKLWQHGVNNGWMLQSLTNQWLPYGNKWMYQDNYAYVGNGCNDQISSIELFHEHRWDGYQFSIHEHANYGGLNVYFWFTPWQSQNYQKWDLWTVTMTYWAFWTTTWNDQMSSWRSKSGN